MGKGYVPPDRAETIRDAIAAALREAPLTARELSERIGVAEREIGPHLEHLARSAVGQKSPGYGPRAWARGGGRQAPTAGRPLLPRPRVRRAGVPLRRRAAAARPGGRSSPVKSARCRDGRNARFS